MFSYQLRLIAFIAMAVALVCISSVSPAQDNKEDKKPLPRESLRYDGKPFEYWQSHWQIELKSENRIECLRALGAFGSNGYAAEASQAIIEMIRKYPTKGFKLDFEQEASKLLPEERVYIEAYRSLAKTGNAGVAAILTNLDHANIKVVAQELLVKHHAYRMTDLSEKDLSHLLSILLADDQELIDVAKDILRSQITGDEKLLAAFVREVEKAKSEKRILQVFTITINSIGVDSIEYESYFLGSLLSESKTMLPLAIDRLRRLKIQQNWEMSDGGRVLVGALGSCGAKAKSVLPELKSMVKEEKDERIKEFLQKAVNGIEGENIPAKSLPLPPPPPSP